MADIPLLLEPEQLADMFPLNKVLIIDQSKLENFVQGHIPGAVHLDFKRLQRPGTPVPGLLPDVQELEAVFSELGLTPDTHVICSDDEGGGWAGRLIWVLDSIGHTQYSYVNGGIVAWREAGLPQETGEHATVPSSYRISAINTDFSMTKDEVLARIGDDDFAIWDARSAAEYTGEKVISKRGGHIPGAVNYEWTRGMDKARGLRIQDLNEFRQLLADMGIDDSKQIATHCQTHHRSGFTYLVAKILGYDVRGYAGSWSEWGNDENTPIVTGPQPN
ncbi:MAG: thiosulfate sulfurtransferase [Thalassolituus sp.]|jgi:thiosulfate/3-mercaptopyruvate sulfurtransferase|nr:MAG: thiosulfate sulfurtransferase [Thalassolituus sp.]